MEQPEGIALDQDGNLFIADSYNNNVRKVSRASYLPQLTLDRVTFADAGDYSVIVSNAFGCVTSAVAHLTVAALGITQQPADQAQLLGKIATFNVTVSPALIESK